MRYAYTFPALFAAAVIAAPFEYAKRSDGSSDLVGDIGVGAVLGGNGDATGVKNAKRDDESLIDDNDGYGYEDYDDDDLLGLGDLLKRDDEDLIGGGSVAGILKRSEGDLVGDVGVAAVAAGDGSATGVQNAKRDDELLGGLIGGGSSSGGGSLLLKRYDEGLIGSDGESNDYNNGHLLGAGDIDVLKRSDDDLVGDSLGDVVKDVLGLLKRSEEGVIGDVGAGAVVGGDGDATGVKNAKREDEVLSTDLIGFANILKTRSEGIVGDVGVTAVLAGDGSATGVKNAKRQPGYFEGLVDTVGSLIDLREANDDTTDGANINDKRSENLGIDGENLLTGAGVADDVDIGTPIVGIANPLSLRL
ncbi:hypothetical protein N7481_006611 [Penicillium waksmanii]|uniref:uncharacterized protein n=1 Tax=Penicillium waksmanii TaxID=69791 RepID=UPI002548CCB6|nr:uncharacterized protein N7481_006611 [Penicillium waksmanii]KAJ5984512.1 hypothetical protein N7481_006611 [Penicillium waksmanii]